MEEIRKKTEYIGKDPKTGKFVEGNPGGGRPKGSFSLVELLKKKLQEECPGANKTYAQAFIDRVIGKAQDDGDVAMMRDIIDRVDGKPKQAIDHTTLGEKMIQGVIMLPVKNGNTENPLATTAETE